MQNELWKTRIYSKVFEGRSDVIKWDIQPIKDGQDVRIVFNSVNSKYKQGIFFRTDSGIKVNGVNYPQVILWEDSKEVIFTCFTKDGLLNLYNVWFDGRSAQSQAHTAGMVIVEEGGKLIYHCNDFGYETNFDKLVFTLELL